MMLLAPLRYWRVRHPIKWMWDYALPITGSILLTSILLFWPQIPSPFAEKGFLAGLQNLYAILGGFFVAALTLLSTAETAALLQPLSGNPAPRFSAERVPLERRRFLCLLFGYLAFTAFALYAVGLLAQLLAPGARSFLPTYLKAWVSGAFLFAYNFWLSHVFVSTLVGLYYFTDRLQRPDIVVTQSDAHPAE